MKNQSIVLPTAKRSEHEAHQDNIVEATPSEIKLGGLAASIRALPINPARDLYGIENEQIQAISYVSQKAIQESQRKSDHFASANIVGAWLISLANHLGLDEAKTDLVKITSQDMVRKEPALIATLQMVADEMKPWIMHSKDAMRFASNIMSRPETHPLIAIAFLPLVSLEQSLPWFYRAYNLLYEPLNLSLKAAIMQNLIAHQGMVRSHIKIPELAATRRSTYEAMAKSLGTYRPSKEIRPPQQSLSKKVVKRVALLLPSFDHLSKPDFKALTKLLKTLKTCDDNYEFALYELDETHPDINQKGFMSIQDDRHDEKFTASMMANWREIAKSIRRHDKALDYDYNMRLFMSALYNFAPDCLLAINIPHSLVKGALRHHYPLLEWQSQGPYGLNFAQHILAITDIAQAQEEFAITKQGDLRQTNLMELPPYSYEDDAMIHPIAAKLHEAIQSAFDL